MIGRRSFGMVLNARRGFLKTAGLAGLTGLSIGAGGQNSAAQDAGGTGHVGPVFDIRGFGATGDGSDESGD
jgi:hypothetical protein